MVTDGDLLRTLNALAVTLNDQKVREFDVPRFQEIVTGALGGERKLEVHRVTPAAGFLRDDAGDQVAELRFEDGVWSTRMRREPSFDV